MSFIKISRSIRDENPVADAPIGRPVVFRTNGRGHGEVFRLISPNDLGEQLKPFVFLDSFGGVMDEFAAGGKMHPHSGIGYGGVEWMRAGGGVWHGRELSSGKSERIHGYQLWLALPAELELSEVESQYFEASAMPQAGPA